MLARARPLRPPLPPLPVVSAKSDTIEAPTKGWRANGPLAAMKRGDAVILDNWFPTATACKIRKGFRSHATGLGGSVETLAEWSYGTTSKLVAAANLKLWNASSAGAAVNITGATTPLSNRWQTANMAQYLLLFDGLTTPQKYDGTTVADAVYTGAGLTPANLIFPCVHKNRLYIAEKESLTYWYGGVDAITGALTEVDLASVFSLGGELMGIFSWSRAGADTLLNVLCFMSSMGEILVYAGGYPGAADWGTIARLYSPPPIGRRFSQSIGGDVALITRSGVLSLLRLAASGTTIAPQTNLTDRISQEFNSAALNYGENFGWNVLAYPDGYYMLVNIPVSPASVAHQYVMNTQTGAWCRFKGQNAQSWGLYSNGLYFGGADGVVYHADTGANDSLAAIVSDLMPAYDYFHNRQSKKRFLNARPIITSTGRIVFTADMQVDFEDRFAAATVNLSVGGSPWNTSPWNTTPWSSGMRTFQDAIDINGVGYAGALRLRASTTNIEATLNAIGLTWEQGAWL